MQYVLQALIHYFLLISYNVYIQKKKQITLITACFCQNHLIYHTTLHFTWTLNNFTWTLND